MPLLPPRGGHRARPAFCSSPLTASALLRPRRAPRAAAAFPRACAAPRAPPPPPAAAAAAALPPSVGVSHAAGGVRVLVVGCVHGAAVSARDAARVVSAAAPAALVLELCPARLAVLRRSMALARDGGGAARRGKPAAPTFAALKAKFGGAAPAAMAAALNALYDVQRAAGVDPGVEFKAALDAADAASAPVRVVCGDADAADTVRALTRAVAQPARAVAAAPAALRFLAAQFARPPPGGVSVAAALLAGRGARVRESLAVFFPLCTAVYASAALAAAAVGGARDAVVAGSGAVAGPAAAEAVMLAGSAAQTASLALLFLTTLTFVYVLIDERDRLLARSIRDAAAAAVAGGGAGGGPPVVVAVVGLLHVNGILKYLGGGDGGGGGGGDGDGDGAAA